MAWSNQGGQGAHGCQKLRCSKVTTAEIGGRIPVCSERLLFSIAIQKSKLFFCSAWNRGYLHGMVCDCSVFILYCTMATEQKYNFHPSTPEECPEAAPEGPVIAPAPGFWDPGHTWKRPIIHRFCLGPPMVWLGGRIQKEFQVVWWVLSTPALGGEHVQSTWQSVDGQTDAALNIKKWSWNAHTHTIRCRWFLILILQQKMVLDLLGIETNLQIHQHLEILRFFPTVWPFILFYINNS